MRGNIVAETRLTSQGDPAQLYICIAVARGNLACHADAHRRSLCICQGAAGIRGLGIMQAAKEACILAIDVASNQNGLHHGTMLTSGLKRVDLAV
jgi:hypothetical protein